VTFPWTQLIFLCSAPYSDCRYERLAFPIGLGTTYEISLFYHVGMIRNWLEIMQDQFSLLERCGLGYMASHITISYSNPSEGSATASTTQQLQDILKKYPFSFRLNATFIDASQQFPYERPILEATTYSCRRSAQDLSLSKKTHIVFYFHNKGSSKYVEPSDTEEYKTYLNIYHWRRYMEWFLLERPNLCIRAILNHGTMTCGVNLQKEPSKHYSGMTYTHTPWSLLFIFYSLFHTIPI
jgi:hypothetical protein